MALTRSWEDIRTQLEAAGCVFQIGWDNEFDFCCVFPDDTVIRSHTPDDFYEKASAHYEQQQELARLRADNEQMKATLNKQLDTFLTAFWGQEVDEAYTADYQFFRDVMHEDREHTCEVVTTFVWNMLHPTVSKTEQTS